MQTWYECKVKHIKIDNNGNERKVTDNILIDAVSFTDAETRIFQQMKELTSGEFLVLNIKRSNITEIFTFGKGEFWYKSKISMMSIDEEAGKEKRSNSYSLVMADNTDEALVRLKDELFHMAILYEVLEVKKSNIIEVFPYVEPETKE